MNDLNEEQKKEIREGLIISASKLIGIPYQFGSEWTMPSVLPLALDCSEMTEGLYAIQRLQPALPDGSQAQFDFTVPVGAPKPGDLAFFGRGANPRQVYHVGMVFDKENIIEARAFDPSASFPTGKVILRPIARWKDYKNFLGFMSHPKLA